jgi:hypothetical protein
MTHDYHEGLPGFSPAQILHDGCGECERRSTLTGGGVAYLDMRNFARAWVRAARWEGFWEGFRITDVARAEIPLLNTLWAVQCQLENFGVPAGTLPIGVSGARD